MDNEVYNITITDTEDTNNQGNREYKIEADCTKNGLVQALLKFSEGDPLWLAWIDDLFRMNTIEEITNDLSKHNIIVNID